MAGGGGRRGEGGVAGITKLTDSGDRYEVSHFSYNPMYDELTVRNDIAVITIAGDFWFNHRVEPVALASTSPMDGEQGTGGMILRGGPFDRDRAGRFPYTEETSHLRGCGRIRPEKALGRIPRIAGP